MKSLLLPLAFLLGLSTANAATISLTYVPSSGSPVTVSGTIDPSKEAGVQVAIMGDPACGFVTTTINIPAVPAVMAADGVTVVTPAVPAGTATQRNPATFEQAFSCIAGKQVSAFIAPINAAMDAAAATIAAQQAAANHIVVVPQ